MFISCKYTIFPPNFVFLSHKVKELLEAGAIGEPRVLTATLCYQMEGKERIMRPELCGGALLDLGVYVLNFARMYFGTDITKTVSNCHMGTTGTDMMESISLSYTDGKMANLQSGAVALNDRQDSLVYATFPTRVLGKSSHTSII